MLIPIHKGITSSHQFDVVEFMNANLPKPLQSAIDKNSIKHLVGAVLQDDDGNTYINVDVVRATFSLDHCSKSYINATIANWYQNQLNEVEKGKI